MVESGFFGRCSLATCPPTLFERPKQGFTVPLKSWFTGSVRDAISSLPMSERLRASGWFQTTGIQTLVRQHIDGLRDHSQRLFSLLVLDEWLAQAEGGRVM